MSGVVETRETDSGQGAGGLVERHIVRDKPRLRCGQSVLILDRKWSFPVWRGLSPAASWGREVRRSNGGKFGEEWRRIIYRPQLSSLGQCVGV